MVPEENDIAFESDKYNPKLISKEYIKKSTITALMPLTTNLFNSCLDLFTLNF